MAFNGSLLNMKIYSFDPKKRTKVLCGTITDDSFHRDVTYKHLMRINNSYAIQEDAFQELISKGVKKIFMKVKETGDIWESPIDSWLNIATVADYGHGKQRFLSLKHMQRHLNTVKTQ